MRSAGNFHPEWGYLAPAPSFMRTARVALVATAIGATAGAVVVVSLVVRPGATEENSSIAAHALVSAAPIVTTPSVSASPAGQTPAGLAQAPMPLQTPGVAAANKPETANLASAGKPDAVAVPSAAAPGNATALAEPPAGDVAAAPTSPDSINTPDASATKKTEFKKHRSTTTDAMRRWQAEANARRRWRDDRGIAPIFRRLFSFSDSSSYEN